MTTSQCCYKNVPYPVNTTISSTMSEDQCVRATLYCVVGGDGKAVVVTKMENYCDKDYATKDQMENIKDLLSKGCKMVDYPHTNITMKSSIISIKWTQCKEKACTKIRDLGSLPLYFEMYNCTIDCPGLQDLMVAQAYMGISVTYESVICGQMGVEYCKSSHEYRNIELVGVKAKLIRNEECGEAEFSLLTISDKKTIQIEQDCDLSCEVRTNLVEHCSN